jgi:hypothetical protein
MILSLALIATPDRVGAKDAAAGQGISAAQDSVSYETSADKNIRVSVADIVTSNNKSFLPKDKNWLQLRVNVANTSGRPVSLDEVKVKLANGTVISAATAATDLAKAPTVTGTVAKSGGIMAAGQIAGYMVFPPLALVASGVALFSLLGGHESWRSRQKKIEASLLERQTIAPGTSVEGLVFVPALRDQTALIVFYTADRVRTLTVPRHSGF